MDAEKNRVAWSDRRYCREGCPLEGHHGIRAFYLLRQAFFSAC